MVRSYVMSHSILAHLIISIDGVNTVAATVALPGDMTDNLLNEYVAIKAVELTHVPIGRLKTRELLHANRLPE